MSFDGFFTHAMVKELNDTLATGRVSKIHQPYPGELILVIRANRHNQTLLLSANPTYPRIQITDVPYRNPKTPTKYAMTMRKYLEGAILESIKQLDNDRVVELAFDTRDELGDAQNLLMYVEIMSRHSNVSLVNTATNKIIDTIKHVNGDQNRYRLLLPGATFVMPPKQENKLNPFIANQAYADLALKHTDVKELKSELQTVYQGLASDTASYLATQLIDSDNTPQTYQEFLQHFDHPTPTLTKTPDGKVSFSVFKPDTIGEQISYPTLSALLDGFYTEKSQLDRTRQVAGQLIQIISNILKKDYSKIKKLNQTMEDTKKADQFRIKGEILTTYLHKIEPGMTEITLENFYDNNSPIKITLSNQLTASQNAQKYFTRYQKLRNAVAHVEEQLALTNQEVEYLESIQSQIELASPADTEEIKLELQQQGYLRENQNKKKKARVTISKPEEYTATDGTTILVGKNNLQNERLTFKVANKDDIWLHVKDIPGSHVVIRDSNPSDETIQEAANIAAYFSKGRDSAHVPVDYLPVKRLKKPAGTNPGFVTFTGQTTLSITPDSQKVNELRTK